MTTSAKNTPENDRSFHDNGHGSGHRCNGRGSYIIDRHLDGVGRIKRASGAHDLDTLNLLNAEITRLHRLGRRATLTALREGQIHPLALLDGTVERAPAKRPSRHQLYLYAVQASPSGYVKIGITQHIERRVSQIRVGCFEEVALLMAVPCQRVDEMVVHQQLADDRLRGEWYRPSDRVVAWVKGVKKAGRPLFAPRAVIG